MDTPTTTTDFTTFIDQERTRIKEAIKAANAKRREAEREIQELETELTAIAAYDAARKGTKASERRAPSGRRGEKRQAILDLIAQHEGGMSRHELIDQMNARGDKSATQSISNALSALKKAGQLTQEGKRYVTPRQYEASSSLV
jgi:DNA-binding transcriptional ArsR family regulator